MAVLTVTEKILRELGIRKSEFVSERARQDEIDHLVTKFDRTVFKKTEEEKKFLKALAQNLSLPFNNETIFTSELGTNVKKQVK